MMLWLAFLPTCHIGSSPFQIEPYSTEMLPYARGSEQV